jgi:hypothetical protein
MRMFRLCQTKTAVDDEKEETLKEEEVVQESVAMDKILQHRWKLMMAVSTTHQ